MWIFTPTGFLSIVVHRDKPGVLLVRARARSDLETVSAFFVGPVQHTPDADYPYRVEMLAQEFVAVLAVLADRITYDNFKDEVARQSGPKRASVYHDIWAAMRYAQDDGLLEK